MNDSSATDYFVCPYDKSHVVHRSRKAIHMYKCGRNYRDERKRSEVAPSLEFVAKKDEDNGSTEENRDVPEGGQDVSVLDHVKRDVLKKCVLRCTPSGLSKSKRREFRKQEAERHRHLSCCQHAENGRLYQN